VVDEQRVEGSLRRSALQSLRKHIVVPIQLGRHGDALPPDPRARHLRSRPGEEGSGPRPQKGSRPTRHHSEGATGRASPQELDVVYRALLGELAQNSGPAFHQELDRRGVPADSPLRKLLRWAGLKGRSAIAAKLVAARLEPILARTPGFHLKSGNRGSTYWTFGGSPGLWIPVSDAKGRIVAICIRPETSQGGKYSSLSSKKHDGAKAVRAVHVPLGFTGDTSTVRLTEGALKANIATALDPTTLTLGMPGLYARDLVKTLRQLKVKTVRLALDADAYENLHVAKAVQAHYHRLKKAFAFELEVWSKENGKGIDDLLAAGKQSQVLSDEAAAAAVASMVQSSEKATSGGRVVIHITENESEVVRAVIGALAKNDRIFCRDTALVEIGWTSDATPAPKIVALKVPAVRTRITESVDLRSGEDEEPANPPHWLAPATHANNIFPGIRPLHAVATSPVLRPDGTIHQLPGYDPITRIMLIADAEFAPIPVNPTQEDAKRACRLLLDGVGNFPFLGETDQAVWLAEVLTMSGRHAIAGPVPLFFHIANTPGSGKTALAKAAALISTGYEIPSAAYPTIKGVDHAEEIRKVITSCAIEGHLAFLLDNAPSGHGCGCSALDAFATSTTNSDRQLGTNQAPRRPMYTVAVITGNNIRPTGDTVRRTLAMRLEAHAERPEEEEYPGPEVTTWAKHERGTLFTAALTILSAYIRAGRPSQKLKPFGSFEEWSALVRSAIVWCELPDPCGNRQQFNDEDEERARLTALFDLMEIVKPAGEFLTVADITGRVRDATEQARPAERKDWTIIDVPEGHRAVDLYRQLFSFSKGPDGTKLGHLLKRLKGRTVGGRRLEKGPPDAHTKAVTWRVELAEVGSGNLRNNLRKTDQPPQNFDLDLLPKEISSPATGEIHQRGCGGCSDCGGSNLQPPQVPPHTQVEPCLDLHRIAEVAEVQVDPLRLNGTQFGIPTNPNTRIPSQGHGGGAFQPPQPPHTGSGRMGWCSCGSKAMSQFCRVCRKCLDAETART
jgi:hypothetical protein